MSQVLIYRLERRDYLFYVRCANDRAIRQSLPDESLGKPDGQEVIIS
jgi:hypothetical protein